MPPRSTTPALNMRPREEILIGLGADHDFDDEGLEGYDSSQRAEILEATVEGPDDGVMQIELVPDA